MIPIKIILAIFLLIVLRAFLVQKSRVLIKRVIVFFVFFLLLFLVMFPDVSTSIAHLIGVGRGVDLIFYFSHLFLLLLIIALWKRYSALMEDITKLSRIIAIQNADKGDKGKDS